MSPCPVRRLRRVPKPLIPVDGRPLVNHWLELLTAAGVAKDDIFVVTNQHFYPQFSKWAQDNGVSITGEGGSSEAECSRV